MPGPVAVLDANVLFSAPLRDLLLELAVSGAYTAKWSDQINREWMTALAQARPDIPRSRIEQLFRLMSLALPNARVAVADHAPVGLVLPDPGDRHVLAAAMLAEARTIVTFNTRHFPVAALARFGLVAVHPDRFLCDLHDRAPADFAQAVHRIRARLKRPPVGVADYLARLREQRLGRLARRLERRRAAL